jgi:hypothetical protein
MMPYGKRPMRVRNQTEPQDIHFDMVFQRMIDPGIRGAGLEVQRADQTFLTGSISRDMFESIYSHEAAIADISIANPNVFYELGVRHALCEYCTLLIRNAEAEPMSDGAAAPFDLNDSRFISYRIDDEGLKQGASLITQFLKTSIESKRTDSPVRSMLPYLSVSRRGVSLSESGCQKYRFRLKGRDGVLVGIAAGALQSVADIDVWVNSENTQFEMARVFESSISSTIRYLGSSKAVRDGAEVLGDEVYSELKKKKKALVGNKTYVKNATAVLTEAYELAHSPYNVKKIAHVASVTGINMRGFQPVQDRRECIRNVLDAVSANNKVRSGRADKLRSVLFPLLGAGQARGLRSLVVEELLSATLEYLRGSADKWLREVYFLAVVDADRDLLLQEFGKYPEIERIE